MKITKVEYSKTFNLGNYQSAKIGFECEVEQEDIDKSKDSFHAATSVLHVLKELVKEEGAKL